MNTQKINFKSALIVSMSPLSADMMALVFIGLLFLLMLVSMVLGGNQFKAMTERKRAFNLLQEAKLDYENLAKKYPLLATEKPLVKQVQEFANEIKKRREQFQELTHSTLRRGFSNYMGALAKATPASMWLTEMDLNQDNGSYRIEGLTTNATATSDLIKNLTQTSAFNNVAFDLFYIKKLDNKPYMKFAIANDSLGLDEELEEGVAKP